LIVLAPGFTLAPSFGLFRKGAVRELFWVGEGKGEKIGFIILIKFSLCASQRGVTKLNACDNIVVLMAGNSLSCITRPINLQANH